MPASVAGQTLRVTLGTFRLRAVVAADHRGDVAQRPEADRQIGQKNVRSP